jgi:predicted permease
MLNVRRCEKSFWLRGAGAVAFFLLVAGGRADALAATTLVASTPPATQVLQLAVQPGGPHDIVVQALANATCTLSPRSDDRCIQRD